MEYPEVEFLDGIVKQIVEKPEAVKIERKVDDMGTLLELTVDKDDMGRVVGKSGQTAKSLRILLRVIGSKNNARINMKILEPQDGTASSEVSDAAMDSADLDI